MPSLEEGMEGMDAVIHAAAKVSFASGERKELYKINIEGTANVINAALALNVGRFLHISSVAALGNKEGDAIIGEGRQWEEGAFNTHYGMSKYQAEMEVWRGMGEGLNVTIVNPSTILGYGDWDKGSCAIFKSVFNEFPWYTNGINGFVDVRDVAAASIRLLEENINGERFILNGDNWTFRRLFDQIADGMGKRHPSREATPLLSSIAWRLEWIKSVFTGKPPMLTRETAKIAQRNTRFDNSKILQHLPGFQFTPLEQTVKEACLSYREAAGANSR